MCSRARPRLGACRRWPGSRGNSSGVQGMSRARAAAGWLFSRSEFVRERRRVSEARKVLVVVRPSPGSSRECCTSRVPSPAVLGTCGAPHEGTLIEGPFGGEKCIAGRRKRWGEGVGVALLERPPSVPKRPGTGKQTRASNPLLNYGGDAESAQQLIVA